MNGLMGMGLLGWIGSLVIGFVIGGIFFMSIKAQVDYVVRGEGPTWLLPVALYARLVFVAVVLVLVAVFVPRQKVAGALLAGVVGVMVARVLISRMVRSTDGAEEDDEG